MSNIPKLRFEEFEGEWNKSNLDKICERITRKNTDLISSLPLTISAQYGLVDQETFFNKKVASSNLSGYYLLKNGEFAYNKSYSTGYPWGAIKRLEKYNEGVLSSLYICFNFLVNNLLVIIKIGDKTTAIMATVGSTLNKVYAEAESKTAEDIMLGIVLIIKSVIELVSPVILDRRLTL